MKLDADRAVVGLVCSFGTRSASDAWVLEAEQFADWIDLGMSMPMRIDHGDFIDPYGRILNIGRWTHFAITEYPVPGLLSLGQIDAAEGFGDQLLHDLHLQFSQQWLPVEWAPSIGCRVDDEMAIPFEISLTRRPADPYAGLLGAGESAVDTWNWLTESSAVSPLAAGLEAVKFAAPPSLGTGGRRC